MSLREYIINHRWLSTKFLTNFASSNGIIAILRDKIELRKKEILIKGSLRDQLQRIQRQPLLLTELDSNCQFRILRTLSKNGIQV